MSVQKLAKFMQKPRSVTIGHKSKAPVIISDSKGEYLKSQIIHPEDRNIIWWCKRETTIDQSLRWLRSNIDSKIQQLGNIHFYVWLGTCNITTKTSDFTIALTSQSSDASNSVFNKFKEYIDIIKPYPNCKLTFVEIPHYSIVHWNKRIKPAKAESLTEQDIQLENQIEGLNKLIHDWNTAQEVHSPLLNIHLIARKQIRRGKNKPSKKYINYNLLVDGIHPKPILAKTWLAELSQQIRKDCWH
jgi:hypothetical protein